MTRYLTQSEYTTLFRHIGDAARDTELDVLHTLLAELATVPDDDGVYVLNEQLVARIIIVNMCDVTLQQFHTSNGEIDYAMLGRNSQDAVEYLMRSIYYFVP